jgi:DNA-binding MarR family transcriptional regulator
VTADGDPIDQAMDTEQGRDAEQGGDAEPAREYVRMGLPGLLRAARRAYGTAIRIAFTDAGFADMPRNGAYVLARVYDDEAPFGRLSRELGISKQAVSQLIDTMVMRGYLERTADSADRRRMLLHLTPRGRAAATVSWEAATAVDEELLSRLSADGVSALRAGLATLCEIGAESGTLPPGRDRD